jgi:hypothetical protein
MPNLLNKFICIAALLLPLMAFGADAPPPESGQKSKLAFVRHHETVAFLKARIDVNGQRLDEIGKDGATQILIDPGLALVTIDEALVPGKFQFSFTAEKGAEYLFEITADEVDAEHLFGVPPKVANGKMLVNGGSVKATLFSVILPKPVEPEPVAASKPVKVEPVSNVAPMAPAPLTIKDQLQMLKDLHDQGLISNEIYNEKQLKILDGLK